MSGRARHSGVKKKLKLTIGQIRSLQKDHGISNLLNPSKEDGEKLASLDFLTAMYYEGSRSWDPAPSKDEIENADFHELVNAVQAFLKGETAGNG